MTQTMPNTPQFLNQLDSTRSQLKPTITVVRTLLSVISDGWEDAAIGKGESVSTKTTTALNGDDVGFLEPDYGWEEMHGFLGNSCWEAPCRVTFSDVEARPGYASKLAHEYQDTPEVFLEKLKLLAALIKRSNHCLLYTGAGIRYLLYFIHMLIHSFIYSFLLLCIFSLQHIIGYK
jgi:hypothetical protein